MANTQQVVDVIVKLTDQSKDSAQRIVDGITAIISSLERLEKSLGKKPTETIESALKAAGKFSEESKTKIDLLSTSFNNLNTNILAVKSSLSGLTIPKNVVTALQAITTAPVAAAPTKTSRKKTPTPAAGAPIVTAVTSADAQQEAQAQATTAALNQQKSASFSLAAGEQALTQATAEEVLASKQAQEQSQTSAQQLERELAIVNGAANAYTQLRLNISAIVLKINEFNSVLQSQGTVSAEATQAAKAIKLAFDQLESSVRNVDGFIRSLSRSEMAANQDAQLLSQAFLELKASIQSIQSATLPKILSPQEYRSQQLLVTKAQKELQSYKTALVDVEKQLQTKGPEEFGSKNSEKAIASLDKKANDLKNTLESISKQPIRPPELDVFLNEFNRLTSYRTTNIDLGLQKALNVRPEVTEATKNLDTLKGAVRDTEKVIREFQTTIFKGRGSTVLKPGFSVPELREFDTVLSAVITKLNSAFKRVRSTPNPFKESEPDARAYGNQVANVSKQVQSLFTVLTNSSKTIRTQIKNLGEYGDEWIGINRETGLHINSLGDLTGSAATIGKTLGRVFEGFAARTGGAVDSVQRIRDAVTDLETQMIRFRSGVVTWSIGLLMMSTAIAAPFQMAIASYKELSDNLAQAGAITGATADQFNKLERAAFDMGRTTRFTTLQASQALVQLGRNGFNAVESIDLLPTALKLAQAAAMDFGQATDIITNIMTSFNMKVEDFPRAADVLTQAFISSNATLENLGYAFTYVGSLAKGLGADFDDLIGALSKLHDAGFKGTMAGTALRGALDGLFNPTKQEAEIMGDLASKLGLVGFNIRNAQGDFVGWVEIIKQLEAASFTSEQALKLFGQRAGPGIAALLQIGSAELERYLQTLKTSEGVTKRLSDVMENTLQGRFLALRSALEGLGETFVKGVEPVLKALAGFAANIINTFTDIILALGPIGVIVENLTGAFVVLTTAIGAATFAWFVMIVPVKQLTNALELLFGAARKGISTLLGVNAEAKAATSELMSLNKIRTQAVSISERIVILEAEQAAGNQKNVSQLEKLRAELEKIKAEYIAIQVQINNNAAAIAEATALEEAKAMGLADELARTKARMARENVYANANLKGLFETSPIENSPSAAAAEKILKGAEIPALQGKFKISPIKIPFEFYAASDFEKIVQSAMNSSGAKTSAQNIGKSLGGRIVSGISNSLTKFANSGLGSSLAMVLSTFTSVVSSEFLIATIAVENLIGASTMLGKVWEKLLIVFNTVIGVLKKFTLLGWIVTLVTSLYLAYRIFKSTTDQVIVSVDEQNATLRGLQSELQNVINTYEQLSQRQKDLTKAGKIGEPGVIASLNRDLISANNKMQDVIQGAAKLGVLKGANVTYKVKTEIIDGQKVYALIAQFKDGTEAVQGFSSVAQKSFLDISSTLKGINSVKNVFDEVLNQSNIDQANAYLQKIKEIKSEIELLSNKQKVQNSILRFFDVAFYLQKLSDLTGIDVNPFENYSPEQGEKLVKQFGQLADTQRALTRLRQFETLDLVAQNEWIKANSDAIKGGEKALRAELAAGRALRQEFEKTLKSNRIDRIGSELIGFGLELDDLFKLLNERAEKFSGILEKAFSFNTEALQRKFEELDSILESTLSGFDAQFENEKGNLNDTFSLLTTFGKDRIALYQQLKREGYKYELEDYVKTAELELKKRDAALMSVSDQEAAYEEYYLKQKEYLGSLGILFTGFGETTKKALVEAIRNAKPVITKEMDAMTENTFTKEIDGQFYVIPHVVMGKWRPEEEALQLWRQGLNKEVGIFSSLAGAESAATFRSAFIGEIRADEISKVLSSIGVKVEGKDAFKEVSDSANQAKESITGVSSATEVLGNVAEGFKEKYLKGLQLVNELDQKTLGFAKTVVSKRIKIEEDLQKSLFAIRKSFSDKFLELEKDRIETEKKLNAEITNAFWFKQPKNQGVQFFAPDLEEFKSITQAQYSALSKAEQKLYQKQFNSAKYKEYKAKVKETRKYEIEQAKLTSQLFEAYSKEDVDAFNKVSDAVIKLSEDARKAAEDNKIDYRSLGIDVLLGTAKRMNNELKTKYAEAYKTAGEKLQESLDKSVLATENLRDAFAILEQAITSAFGEKGAIEGFVTKLGEISTVVKEASDGLKALAESMSLMMQIRFGPQWKEAEKQVKTFDNLRASGVRLEEVYTIIGKLSSAFEVYTKGGDGAQKASKEITDQLSKLANMAPGLEQLLVPLYNIEGLNSDQIREFSDAFKSLVGLDLKQFMEIVGKEPTDQINPQLEEFTRQFSLASDVVSAKALQLKDSISGVQKGVEIKRDTLLGALQKTLKETLPAALDDLQGRLSKVGAVDISIDPARQKLNSLNSILDELLRKKDALASDIPVSQVAPQINVSEKKQQANVVANQEFKPQVASLKEPIQQAVVEPVRNATVQIEKQAEKVGQSITTGISNKLENVKNQIEEKYQLLIDASSAITTLDLIISKLKSIIEYIKSIGTTQIKLTSGPSGEITIPAGETPQANIQTAQNQIVPAEVKPILNKDELNSTIKKASKQTPPLNVYYHYIDDSTGEKVTDTLKMYQEFNKQQQQAGARQIDTEKVPQNILNIGKAATSVVRDANKELQALNAQAEKSNLNLKVELYNPAPGKTFDQLRQEMLDYSAKTVPDFKLPVNLLPEVIKVVPNFGEDYPQKWFETYFKDNQVKVAPELNVSGFKIVYPFGENPLQQQIDDWAKGTEVKPGTINNQDLGFKDTLLRAIEEGKKQVEPGIKVPVYPELDLQKWNPPKLPDLELKISSPDKSVWSAYFSDMQKEADLTKAKMEALARTTDEAERNKIIWSTPEPDQQKVTLWQTFFSTVASSWKSYLSDMQKEYDSLNQKQKESFSTPEPDQQKVSIWTSFFDSIFTSWRNYLSDMQKEYDSIGQKQRDSFKLPDEQFTNIKSAYEELKNYVGSLDLVPTFKSTLYKLQLKLFEDEFTQIKDKIEKTEIELKLNTDALNAGDESKKSIIDELTKNLDELQNQFNDKVSQIKVIWASLGEFKITVPDENKNILDSTVSAIIAGKDTIVASIGSIASILTTSMLPIITQVQNSLNLGTMTLTVQPVIDSLVTIVGLLQEALNLKNQLGSGDIGATTPTETPAFASGGYVTGPGSGVSDSILSLVSNGEYIIDSLTTKFFGPGFFKGLQNSARKGKKFEQPLNKFSKGGYVENGLSSYFKLPKFSKGGYVGKFNKEIISIPTIKLPKFATGGLVGATSGVDYAKLGMTRKDTLATGTPVNLTIYDHKYELRAQPSVADQLRKALSIENLKRGRK
jgi:TP901 family phage tail tape measure protein